MSGHFKLLFQCMVLIYCPLNVWGKPLNQEAERELKRQYDYICTVPSDIVEHIPVLRELAKQCSSAIEIGVRDMNSTWGVLQGLSENPSEYSTYLGIDLNYPPKETYQFARRLAQSNGIAFYFWIGNDMNISCPTADLLFIDSLHTYSHLTFELEKFSPGINKYIALHDTSAPWGDIDDSEYQEDYSEYPVSIDTSKRGLWLAVVDFLEKHPEWELVERRLNCHGFTILQRR